MSRCTAARMRAAISGYFDRYAIVPVISDGQMKRIVRAGGGIRFVSINRAQRPRDFEVGGAPAGVVVRARFLVIEMAAEHDVPGRSVRSRNRRDERLVAHRVVVPRAHDRVQRDVLTARQALLKRARFAHRDHDREGVLVPARIQMSPPDQILIVAPPRAHLIRVVAHKAGRAELFHGLTMAGGGSRVAEHELAAHVLPGVVAPLRAAAHVYELDRDVRALAVVGDRETDVVPRDDPPRLGSTSSSQPASTRHPRLPWSVPNQVAPSPGNVSTCASVRPAALACAMTYSIAS